MLYIIRHGQTEWNKQVKLQGQTDIPLNEAGRQMAIDAGKKYSDIKFDICFSSPLQRARETAELFLRGTDTPIVLDDRLREVNFGTYEGVKNSFDIPDLNVNDFFLRPEIYVADGGAESFEQVYARTGEFLNELIFPKLGVTSIDGLRSCLPKYPVAAGIEECWPNKRNPDLEKNYVLPDRPESEMNILISGHGAMNCSIINQIRNIPINCYWQCLLNNCELIRLV